MTGWAAGEFIDYQSILVWDKVPPAPSINGTMDQFLTYMYNIMCTYTLWNLSNADTNWVVESVLISEVS